MSDEDTQYKEIFDRCVKEGNDKNAILMALINEGGLDVTAAIREYNALARDAGMTMTKDQKEAKIAEVLSEQSFSTREDLDVAQDALIDALDVAPTTAMNYIKSWAEEHDIELPIGQRKQLASKEEVVAFLIANLSMKRADLSKALCSEFGYKKGTSDTILSMMGYMQEFAKQTRSRSASKARKEEAA